MRLIPPMLPPMVGLIAGIMATRIGAAFISAFALIISGLGIYFILTYKNSNPIRAYRSAHWHHIWVILIFTGIGTLDAIYHMPPDLDPEIIGGEYPAMRGYVRDIDYSTAGDKLRIELRSLVDKNGNEHLITPVHALVYAKSSTARVDDVVILSNTLVPLTDSPNSFDSGYARAMAYKGIIYMGHLRENHVLSITGHMRSLKGMAWECRQSLIGFIENTPLSIPAKNFIISVLLGERNYLDPESKEIFSNAGVSHILALSGMHVGIITGIILWILFPLNFIRKRLVRYVMVIPILWGYAWMTGLMPSTVRAAVMTTIFIGAILIERKNNAWNSLLVATFIILLCSPFDIYDVGLQLSFTCVAGIIFFGRRLNPVDQHSHPYVFRFIELILVSLIATGCSWIISAYYFGTFPLMFLPANIIVLPLLPWFIVIVLIYFLLYSLGIHGSLIASCIDTCYDYFIRLLSYLSYDGSTNISIHIPAISVWCWLIAIAFIVIFVHYHKSLYASIIPILLISAAILLIPVYSDAIGREILVKTGGRNPEIAIRDKYGIKEYSFPVNAISALDTGEHRFLIADCDINTLIDYGKVDYLIITRSCVTPLSIIKERVDPKTLVLHSSITRSREAYLTNLADSLSISLHSLRRNSSLRLRSFLE